MYKEYLHTYELLKKGDSSDINELKIINYKNLKLLFPKNHRLAAKKNNKDMQIWANYTGLTSKRPEIIFDYILKIINIENGNKILDIGCGCGEFAINLFLKFKNNISYTL